MCGVLRWNPASIWDITFRDLVIAHDTFLIESWNHTALLACLSYSQFALTHNMNSKTRKVPNMSFADFHPYLEKTKRGIKIGKGNFKELKRLGALMNARK